jgi:ribosomal protein S18 acetylase RimI-like enzyme
MIEVKIFDPLDCGDEIDHAESVYQACGFDDADENIEMILNSAYVGVVYLDRKPVGVGRVISDKVRHSLIVDLNVIKEFRNKGCGKALAIALAKHAKTPNIFLTTDPNNPTLPQFYKKSGFEFREGAHVFEWPKK